MVRRAHGALVVLDHDDRVPEVAQPLERADQPRVVALMEADGGLVEDVEDAHQARPDLRGQPDPLGLAAREGGGRPIERQIAHPDVVEEAQALLDLAQDQARDLALGLGELEPLQPLDRPSRGHPRELVHPEPAHEHRQRLRPQPRPAASRAGSQRHVLLDLLARPVRVGLAIAALEVGHDPLEVRHVGAAAPVAVAVRDVDAFPVGAEQEAAANVLREVLPGGGHVHLPLVRDRLRHLLVVVGRARGPGQDGAVGQRQARVRHDQVRVDLHLRAETGAARAGAVRGVEREHPRLELRHRGAAVEAHEAVRVGGDLPGVDALHVHDALGAGHRRLDGVGEALAQVRAHHEPVHHHRDVVLALLVELDRLLEAPQLPVDLDAREALGAQRLEHVPELALAASHDGREHHELAPLREHHHLVDDLLGGLGLDGATAVVAMGMAHPGPEESQVVVDLRDRADRRARVARGGLLVDRDRG